MPSYFISDNNTANLHCLFITTAIIVHPHSRVSIHSVHWFKLYYDTLISFIFLFYCYHLHFYYFILFCHFRGLEISSPLSDDSLRDLLDPESATQTNHTSVESERRRPRPWLEKPDTSDMIRKAEKRFSRIGAFVYNRRSEAAPTLNRFDGIRFHLKKRGKI